MNRDALPVRFHQRVCTRQVAVGAGNHSRTDHGTSVSRLQCQRLLIPFGGGAQVTKTQVDFAEHRGRAAILKRFNVGRHVFQRLSRFALGQQGATISHPKIRIVTIGGEKAPILTFGARKVEQNVRRIGQHAACVEPIRFGLQHVLQLDDSGLVISVAHVGLGV